MAAQQAQRSSSLFGDFLGAVSSVANDVADTFTPQPAFGGPSAPKPALCAACGAGTDDSIPACICHTYSAYADDMDQEASASQKRTVFTAGALMITFGSKNKAPAQDMPGSTPILAMTMDGPAGRG